MFERKEVGCNTTRTELKLSLFKCRHNNGRLLCLREADRTLYLQLVIQGEIRHGNGIVWAVGVWEERGTQRASEDCCYHSMRQIHFLMTFTCVLGWRSSQPAAPCEKAFIWRTDRKLLLLPLTPSSSWEVETPSTQKVLAWAAPCVSTQDAFRSRTESEVTCVFDECSELET